MRAILFYLFISKNTYFSQHSSQRRKSVHVVVIPTASNEWGSVVRVCGCCLPLFFFSQPNWQLTSKKTYSKPKLGQPKPRLGFSEVTQ